MLFRLHFLLYCIFVSYHQFLFFSRILYYVACAFVICLTKYVLTYLLTYLLTWCGCFQPLSTARGSFLPVLNPVVIPGLRAGTRCAVLRGSLYVCVILCNQSVCSCQPGLKRRLLSLLLFYTLDE